MSLFKIKDLSKYLLNFLDIKNIKKLGIINKDLKEIVRDNLRDFYEVFKLAVDKYEKKSKKLIQYPQIKLKFAFKLKYERVIKYIIDNYIISNYYILKVAYRYENKDYIDNYVGWLIKNENYMISDEYYFIDKIIKNIAKTNNIENFDHITNHFYYDYKERIFSELIPLKNFEMMKYFLSKKKNSEKSNKIIYIWHENIYQIMDLLILGKATSNEIYDILIYLSQYYIYIDYSINYTKNLDILIYLINMDYIDIFKLFKNYINISINDIIHLIKVSIQNDNFKLFKYLYDIHNIKMDKLLLIELLKISKSKEISDYILNDINQSNIKLSKLMLKNINKNNKN